jgi:desulfoferrodoxin (superoxide reductase-like protein)
MKMTPNNTYWTTRDKRRLLIANMDDDHCINCINVLVRKYGFCQWRELESPQEYLAKLVVYAEQEATLIALTDPNL